MAQQFHCVSLCVFQTPVASRRASEISNHARHSTLQIARASMRVSVEFSLRFRRFSSLDYGALRNFNPKQRALAARYSLVFFFRRLSILQAPLA